LAACGKNNTTPGKKNKEPTTSAEQNTLKLAYSKNDSLNPMTTETSINFQITKLVFDGLYKLDSSYQPVPVVAKSAVVGSTLVSVTLNEFRFSDGSDISVNDVISSFYQAKESSAYETRLRNIAEAHIGSDNSVVFDLESPDPFALSCLDFPIVRDSAEGFPLGCGRYSYQRDGDNIYLVVNSYRSDFDPIFRTINLEPVHESDSFESSLVIGNTAFSYNDLSAGTYSRINANNVDIGINNFVYLGFNLADQWFWMPEMRRAVSLCIDRDLVAASAFRSHARPALTLFNPDWYAIKEIAVDSSVNTASALELVKAAGFDPATREISILCNAENEFKTDAAEVIEECLEKAGFYVRVSALMKDAYMQAVKSGEYDMYIGEIRLNFNMDLSPVLTGSASYGIDEESATVLKYADYLAGNCELIDFINTCNEDMIYAPLCYRNGVASYTKSMRGNFGGCDADVFYDIDTWSLK
ncbi:MAG: hypothetical protein IKS04_07365, partial [Clostridia bacterium]|nr:hypothetical protein [Clostridia bacterium]